MTTDSNKFTYSSAAYLPLIFLSLLSISGGIVYRIYALNKIGVALSLISAVFFLIIIQRIKKKINPKPGTQDNKKTDLGSSVPDWEPSSFLKQTIKAETAKKNKIINFLLLIAYCLLLIACFYILFSNQTDKAIISPWQVAPDYFFAFYGLATAVLIIIIAKETKSPIRGLNKTTPYTLNPIPLISLHYFLSFSVALIIYKVGYGFDPFIHQATAELIDKTGAVTPKPFYYLGQYALVVILHKLTFLPIAWLDKLLVPVLAALYLPSFAYQALKKWFGNNKSTLLAVILILALPFSFFIVTTPQNLAYLFLVFAILYGLVVSNIFELILVYLLAAASFIIHPIAGIPTVFFALALTAYHSDRKKLNPAPFSGTINPSKKNSLHPPMLLLKLRGIWKRYGVYGMIFILSSISLPLLFYLLEKNNAPAPDNAINGGAAAAPWLKLFVPNQENFILNFIYLYGFNVKFIVAVLTTAGLLIAYRRRRECRLFFIYFLMSAAIFFSYLLAKEITFNFLISYERDNYSNRLLLISAFFLLPFLLTAAHAFIDKLLKQTRGVKIPLLIFFVIIITASLYLSYPRFDRYFNSRGYSTSQSDIEAVRWIETDASGDYIVLANQQVSAAALREFGFKKYYQSQIKNQKSQIFYYPIPTSGPLYKFYLDMVYKKPSRETMLAAMDLVGVNEGYFILDKYWWAFPKILEEAKLGADEWKNIKDGEIYIFKFTK